MVGNGNYLAILRDRARKRRIYKKYQHTGLTIADMLHDQKHKSLYIHLAKRYDNSTLLSLAKITATKKDIKNRGAYFMKLLTDPAVRKLSQSVAGPSPAKRKRKKKKIIQKSLF